MRDMGSLHSERPAQIAVARPTSSKYTRLSSKVLNTGNAILAMQASAGNKVVARLLADDSKNGGAPGGAQVTQEQTQQKAVFKATAAQFKLLASPYRGKYTPILEPRPYRSCSEAVNAIESDAKAGQWHAHTTPKLSASFSWTDIPRVGKRYKLVAKALWSVDFEKSKVVLPRYKWPNMTWTESVIWSGLEAALQLHEEGHLETAIEYCRKRSLVEEIVYGATQEQARDNMDTRAAELSAEDGEVQQGHDQAQDIYENVTKHGITQEAANLTFDGVNTDFAVCKSNDAPSD